MLDEALGGPAHGPLRKKIIEIHKNHWPELPPERRAVRLQLCLQRIAELKNIMGDSLSDDGLEGFGMLQKYLFTPDVDDVDRAMDFTKFYGELDSVSKKKKFNDALEAFKAQIDANPAAKPKFLIQDIATLQSDAYRYSSNQGLINAIKSNGLHPSDGTDDIYLSFNQYTHPGDARTKLQLPTQNTARYRIEVETNDLASDVNIPYGRPENKHELDAFEPIVKDNTQWGSGGGTQFVTRQQFRVKRIIDLTGQEPDWINPN